MIVLNWVLMSFFSRLMSTFSFLILLFRKVLWHIIQIKSQIWQSVSSDLMAFGGLLVDSMQFDALISQFSILNQIVSHAICIALEGSRRLHEQSPLVFLFPYLGNDCTTFGHLAYDVQDYC